MTNRREGNRGQGEGAHPQGGLDGENLKITCATAAGDGDEKS